MDFMLTKNGDIMLEQIGDTSHQVCLSFFIQATSQAVALKFNFDEHYLPRPKGVCLTFAIGKEALCYKAEAATGKAFYEQLCYNALRTQKQSLKQALDYGSDLYLETNKRITPERLTYLAELARQAIKHIDANVSVTARAQSTSRGTCEIVFDIYLQTHTLNVTI